MISLRRKIDESELLDAGFRAVSRVLSGVLAALPKTALPANPELSAECKANLDQVAAPLKGTASLTELDTMGRVALEQLDQIYNSNAAAMSERDAALKEVVATVSATISSFKGFGERHNASLTKAADGFEALTRIADVNELRRQLHANVVQLRQSVEEMRQQSEEPSRQLEAQISAFQDRLESARKGAGIDRLTGLGSRREAEKCLQKITKVDHSAIILLFDIHGFREINDRHGTLFGDRLLQALAHVLKDRFPEDGTVFRWGADEFLVIASGILGMRLDQCRGLCERFAANRYNSFERGIKTSVAARVSTGGAEYRPGETTDEWYRRARRSLEESVLR